MQKVSHQTRSFDGFTLDLTRGSLLRGTQEIKLRPKPFDALKYLVENPGRLISKGELIQALWPDTAVTDDSLVQCLMEVRRALGDESQQIIKTVPRRGYIFDTDVKDNGSVQVTTYTEETAGVQVLIEEEETNGHGVIEKSHWPASYSAGLIAAHKATGIERLTTAIKQHRLGAVVGLVAITIVAAGVVYFSRPSEAIDSVAVMPFVNVSGDPETEYLSDGLSDSLINNLSQLPSLKKVISFNSVLRYKGKQTDPQAVGRELGVRAVLMGRLIQQGDQLSISTELIDVRDNRRLWGEQYDRKMSDLLLVQRDLSKKISDQLRLKLTGEDLKNLTKPHTDNNEAYQLYLKGTYYLGKRTRDGANTAVEYFKQAIKKDPNYALAYVGLANCYTQMGNHGFIPPKEAHAKAKELVNGALRLDDTLAQAHATLAWLKLTHEWDWPSAEQEYRRAIELNFNLSGAHDGYAKYLSIMGRHQEAIAESKQALVLNPLSINANSDLGVTFHMARQYDQAIEQLRLTIDMDPNSKEAHRNLGLVYQQKAMHSEAIAEFKKHRELNQGKAGGMALGHAYAVAGMKDEARKILARLVEIAKNDYVAPMRFAMIYIGLGENDHAFEWLERSFHEHSPDLRYLKVDPRFDNIRSDPRFANLLRRMKLEA